MRQKSKITVIGLGLAMALGLVASPITAQMTPDASRRTLDGRSILEAPQGIAAAPDASRPVPEPQPLGEAGSDVASDAAELDAPVDPPAPDAGGADSDRREPGPADAAAIDAADAATGAPEDAGDSSADAALDEDAGTAIVPEPVEDAGAPKAADPLPLPVEAVTSQAQRPLPLPSEARPELALKTILAMLALLVLAYAANHPRLRQLEELLGIRSVITTGFPFVALGLIARHPAVGVLNDRVLLELTPLVEFGLGWLGFLVGFRLDLRRLDELPHGSARIVGITTLSASVAIAGACALTLALLGFTERTLFVRTGLVLGAAGAMTAPAAIRALAGKKASAPVVQHLDEVIGVGGLWLIAAYFRPDGIEAQWALPGTAWLLMALGMGVMLGSLLHVILRRPGGEAEFMVIALGGVAFTAGLAAYVRLSPLVIGFVAGTVVTNLPTPRKELLGHTLGRVERSIFLVLLALAGGLWDPADRRGWILMPVFVGSRYLGLWLGGKIAMKSDPETFTQIRPTSTLSAPLSVVAIAVVVNIRILYGGPTIPLIVTAVIGGALLAELIAAYTDKRSRREVAP